MSTAAENLDGMDVHAARSMAECIALLQQFFVADRELEALMKELVPPGPCERDRRRAMVERLASSLWAVFSHHRAVVDGDGVRYDLGPWRSAAELISDLANRAYPNLNLPIRYMDCYVGVLSGEQRGEPTRRLHRWIFEVLQDEGCDWLYSRTAVREAHRTRARKREMAAVLDSSDQAGTAESFMPVPAMIAAYQDVYNRLPDGWPHA